MAEKKPTPLATKVVAGGLVGALVAATAGQKLSPWVLESQTNTIIVAAGGLVVGVVAVLAVVRKLAARP